MLARGSADSIGWAFYVLPSVGLILVFHLAPAGYGLALAFCHAGPAGATFGGLVNFIRMAQSSLFWRGALNSLRFAAASAPIIAVLTVLIAVVAFGMGRRAQWFVRFAFYLPGLLSGAVLSLLYTWMYNPDGLLNALLHAFGREPINWLGQNPTAFRAVVALVIFQGLGPPIVGFLGVLTSVEPSIYEASEIDGCGLWRQTWHFTVPVIFPVFVLSMVGFLTAGLQTWAIPYWLTGGGPNYGTFTFMLAMYREVTMFSDYGAGSAYSLLMTAAVMGLMYSQRRLARCFE